MRRSITNVVSRQLHPTSARSPVRQVTASCMMSTSGPVYYHIDDVERLDFYRPGGYNLIQVGNHLNQRYRVVHKLGYGTYSTIWLARENDSPSS